MTAPRSIDQLIEDQVHRWELSRKSNAGERRREPVITISRQPGCCARAVAEELARRLGFDVFHNQIF